MQSAMCHIIVPSVASPALPHFFPHLFHKRLNFRENDIEHKMHVLIFYTSFSSNTSRFKKN